MPNRMFLPQYITGKTMWEHLNKYTAEYVRFMSDNQPADALMWSVAGMQYKNIGDVDSFIGKKKKRQEIMDAVEILAKKTEGGKGGLKDGRF